MASSLRWRLQVWHGLTLLVVVAGFGSALYFRIRQARLGEIDGELQAAARVLEGTLRAFPPHVLDGLDGFDRFDGRDGPPPPPFPDRPPPGRPPRPPERLEHRLALPEGFRRRHDRPGEAPYFAVWLRDGRLLRADFPPDEGPPPAPSDLAPGRAFHTHQRGPFREAALLGPAQTRIVVGRRIDREMHDLAWLAGQLAAIGVGVLAFGLAGGWVLAGRAVRPLARMSATAASISAHNLTGRIDLAGVDRELADLGGILNAMFARLQTAFERQARFTADASHELRTPLAVIHSHAELALARPRSAEEYREALETSLRAARRMRNLVEGLLTLARADAGNLAPQRQAIDLGALVEETAELLGPLAARRGVAVRVDVREVRVWADPGQVVQVVTNLLSNAIHYNRPGGEVVARVRARAGGAELRVADTGCGIPAEDHGRLFERFYRVDEARSREQGGCGLGLAICKSIVEAHGGAVRFTSEVGKGSTFYVTLPGGGPPRDAPRVAKTPPGALPPGHP
jgi:heavy metal sensor kinase